VLFEKAQLLSVIQLLSPLTEISSEMLPKNAVAAHSDGYIERKQLSSLLN
jgi:hypothetical protein